MGGAVFTPKQQNWKWFKDDAAEPSVQLADENVKPTLPNNTDKIRLRVTVKETGGKAANNVQVELEYSTNESDWYSFGPSAHWDYADGQATEGDPVTSFKTSDGDAYGEYCESGANTVSWGANAAVENDICIVPTSNVSANTTYYFRMLLDSTEVPLNTGETHPQVLTATTTYTMPAAGGSLDVNGTDAGTRADRKLVVDPGGISLAGQTAAALKESYVSVDPDSYSIAGTAAILRADFKLNVDTESYSIAGQDATLSKIIEYVMDAGAGSYSLAGQDATFKRSIKLDVEAASYSVAGQTADLLKSTKFDVDPESYSIAGQVAALLYHREVNVEPGSYSVAGQDVTLSYITGYQINAESGSFAVAGIAAALKADRKIPADTESFSITGQTTDLYFSRRIGAEGGVYAVTGQDATLSKSGAAAYELPVDGGAFGITGFDTVLTWEKHPEVLLVWSQITREVLVRGKSIIGREAAYQAVLLMELSLESDIINQLSARSQIDG